MIFFDLSGEWQMTSPELPGKQFPISLPGDNYTALLEAGEIPDPYWDDNELDVKKYSDYHWVMEREFQVSAEMLKSQRIFFEMDMADTLIEVYVNGVHLLSASNAFQFYRKEAGKLLKSGKNRIRLEFAPVLPEAARLRKKYRFPGKNAEYPTCPPAPDLHLIRKCLCHGGWDWGIQLLVSGVYGRIGFRCADDMVIDHLNTIQKFSGSNVEVTAVARVEAFRRCRREFTFHFCGQSLTVSALLKRGVNEVKARFHLESPELWWPNGYGAQPLHELTVTSGTCKKSARIGIRKLELVSHDDKFGRCFFFRINGVDIFAKGADWIPADAMPSRQTAEKTRQLLESSRDANMNMIRVWGGGQYERDEFYDICDELGLLVWQDFMFSCCVYPAEPEFMASVAREVEYQIPRLRHHASLALWCGDNEVSGAVRWYTEGKETTLVRNSVLYDRMTQMLAGKCRELDDTRVFWPSSPCGGMDAFNDGWHDESRGDMHYWEVWHGAKDFSAYRSVQPRFCSEFGYQSYPSLETIAEFCPEGHYNVFSPVMETHQRCALGNTPIFTMFGKYYRMPNGFANFLYLSQVQQASAIQTGVEYWRSLRPRCMGTLFWQLNDVWPVISWSSLEYSGKWKQLMYSARRFFAPVLVSAMQADSGDVNIHIISDSREEAKVAITARVMDFNGKCLKTMKMSHKAAPGSSEIAGTLTAAEIAKLDKRRVFLTVAMTGDAEGESTFFFEPYKNCEVEKADVKFKVTESRGVLTVEVSAVKPAFNVVLDNTGCPGVFSDNNFTLLPGEAKKITFKAWKKTTAKQLEKAIACYDLHKSYE